jgi:hypothetical protein
MEYWPTILLVPVSLGLGYLLYRICQRDHGNKNDSGKSRIHNDAGNTEYYHFKFDRRLFGDVYDQIIPHTDTTITAFESQNPFIDEPLVLRPRLDKRSAEVVIQFDESVRI